MAKKTTTYMRTANGDVFRTTMPEYHKDCERMTRAEGAELYRAQEIADLKKWIKPGTTIYTKLESVSASGMSRRISVYAVRPASQGQPASIANITHAVSIVTGDTVSDKGGIVKTGCGMDMGFSIVYAFGRGLWPKGTPKPHGTRQRRRLCAEAFLVIKSRPRNRAIV